MIGKVVAGALLAFWLLGSSGLLVLVRAQPQPEAQAPQQIYKYRTKDGRVVFTNILDEVPVEQRAAGKVDLSHVELNTSIGNELNQRLTQEHAQLAESPYCQELKELAQKSELEQLWDEYAVLIVCGGMIAVLILITPMMMTKVHPPEWARVLSKAVPMLLLVGGAMYGMQTANRKAMEVRKQVKPCLAETFAGLGSSDNPEGERLSLIAGLKRDIEAAQEMAATRAQDLEDLARQPQ